MIDCKKITMNHRLLVAVAMLGCATVIAGCQYLPLSKSETITNGDGKKIAVNDATMKQYLTEWSEAKGSIERLADLEGDLTFLLSEVSKLSDLSNTPGRAITTSTVAPARAAVTTPAPQVVAAKAPSQTSMPVTGNAALPVAAVAGSAMPVASAPIVPSVSTSVAPAPVPPAAPTAAVAASNHSLPQANYAGAASAHPVSSTTYTLDNAAPLKGFNFNNAYCAENFQNYYKKSLAFLNFSRAPGANSQLGALQQVEQHLPMLIAANLRNRHNALTPVHLPAVLANGGVEAELIKATQTKAVAEQQRVQFVVTGEVDDMSMTNPDVVESPNYYTRFVHGVHNLFNVDSKMDKRERIFSFRIDVRDGLSGQVVFSHEYRTYGKWKMPATANVGFGSLQFWQTEYGVQVQHLVAKASDEVARALSCEPYIVRVDSRPAQPTLVIQSGSNSGMRTGDTLDLYQVLQQEIMGQYQYYDTRLVRQQGRVYVTEVYPSHSVARVMDQKRLDGQFVVRAP